MDTVIKFLDNYLIQTRRTSVGPVEANKLLEKAGILHDSKDRPGKPLRDLLRKGQIPHAYQSGGKGSNWTIPHSNRQTSTTLNYPSTVKLQLKKTLPKKTITSSSLTNTSELLKVLMNEGKFKNAGDIDSLVPFGSGLYCIRIIDINKLPKQFNKYLTERQHNIIYIGIASESLKKRFLNQELRAKGHGTFFRSIGAVLGYRPLKGSLVLKKNKRNYKFTSADENKIINWINDNLKVNWVEFARDFEVIETELILKYKPLLNLAKNPSAIPLLSELRKECVQIATET